LFFLTWQQRLVSFPIYLSNVTLGMALCLSVCPFVCHKTQVGVISKRMHGSSCFFSVEASFHLCYKEIRVSRKMTLLPSETLSQTLDPKKICHGKSTRVVNKTRQRPKLLTTPATVDASWPDALHVRRPQCCNSITSICCAYVVQLVRTVVQQVTTFRVT